MNNSNKWIYKIRADTISSESGKKYIVYGIELWSYGKRILSIPDVFLSFFKAENLINLCNTLQLDPIHIMEVLEDFLY